jgi:hypothetical protein
LKPTGPLAEKVVVHREADSECAPIWFLPQVKRCFGWFAGGARIMMGGARDWKLRESSPPIADFLFFDFYFFSDSGFSIFHVPSISHFFIFPLFLIPNFIKRWKSLIFSFFNFLIFNCCTRKSGFSISLIPYFLIFLIFHVQFRFPIFLIP